MSSKYPERASCVKVEKRSKETVFILLCEWSDITASYVGRTEQALYNLLGYVNTKLDAKGALDLKLMKTTIFNFVLPNKNIRILNEFLAALTRQSRLMKDAEVNKFFTIGSSSTLTDLLNSLKARQVCFSFQTARNTPPFAEYEEIKVWDSVVPQIHPSAKDEISNPSNEMPFNLYSRVNKTPKGVLEPDIISSSKTASHPLSDTGSSLIPSAEVITIPPKPLFNPPSLSGYAYATIPALDLRPLELNVVALEGYEGNDTGVLSFAKGNSAAVISQTEQGWWCVKIGSRIGWVPGEFWEICPQQTQRISPLEKNPGCFVGSITREECEAMMIKYARGGDFVVRQSLNGNLALSVKHDLEVRHFPIKVTEDGKFNIGQYDFKSVNHIVSYYRKNTLFYDDNGESVMLGRPLIIVKENEPIAVG